MPNFGADVVGGYYKTPVSVIPSIAALIDATAARDPAAGGSYALLDPCAGDGEALLLYAHALFGTPFPAPGKGPRLLLYACELEDTRAGALAAAFRAAGLPAGAATARHSDAFQLTLAPAHPAGGVSLLWANPPYTTTANPIYGRLEQAFLERFTPALTPGSGLLVYIIPGHVLATSALYLATHYDDLAVYRFPAGEYEAYKQIVLLARRRATPLPFGAETLAAQLASWAAAPARLPRLPAPGTMPPRFALPPGARDGLAEFAVSPLDVTRLLAHYTPWALGTLDATAGPPVYPLVGGAPSARRPSWQIAADPGLGLPLDAFLYQARGTVMPPRAEHRALFAASGMFNNLTLLPDDPAAGLPPAIVKGLFEKETVEVKQNVDKEGRVTSVLCVQQPKMRLRLRTVGRDSVQVDLPAGSTPTGATDPRQMNIADLFAVYGRSLATWMRRMFAPTHDPADAARFVPLPPLPRALYQAQAHLVQAGIKQFGGGRNFLLQADLGTGKTTQALTILAAYSPAHYAATVARLRALGDWQGGPRPITRVLVMVPPHLVATWRDERTAVLPGADIVVVERISDLYNEPPDAPTRGQHLAVAARDRRPARLGARYLGDGVNPGAGMTVFVLSRETAKLGPGLRMGVVTHPTRDPRAVPARTCPRCGLPVEPADAAILQKRLTCRQQPVVADRAAGALARALARLLLPAYPQAGTLAALVPDRMLRLQVYGAPLADDAIQETTADTETAADPEADPAGAEGGAADDLAPAERQVRWDAWAVHPDAHGRTRLDPLLAQLATALTTALTPPVPADSPVPALLRATWLLHLALPPALQPPRLRRVVLALARHAAPLPPTDPQRKGLLDTLGRLLLCLLPLDAACYDRVTRAIRRLLQAGSVPATDPFWATLERTRARLLAEQATAARYAADPATRSALAERAPQSPVQGVGDWSDLQIRLTDGLLTWQVTYGTTLAAGAVAAASLGFDSLLPLGGFHRAPVCGAPLYQVTPHPRRWPLASYIYHHAPTRFDAFVFDELHELSAQDSAQAAAMFLLARLPRPALGLTGSLFNGYAESVFLILLAFCAPLWEEFGYHDRGRFALRYGLFKVLKELANKDSGPRLRERGKASLRTEYTDDPILRTLGPAPGFLPALVADYMLGVSAILTQDDLRIDLPPLLEQRVALTVPREDAPGQAVLRSYRVLEDALRRQIGADRWDPVLRGKLLGALVELPSFLVLGTDDVGNGVDRAGRRHYEIRYPGGGPLVAAGTLLPAADLLPKERWLLGQLAAQLERGRNVLVYLRHTGNPAFLARLRRLIRAHVGVDATVLDATAVDPRGRGAWITHEVIGLKRRVLLVNPESVKTGLNELNRYFTTIIWYEGTYNVLTFRQANGRIRRIGSDPGTPIEILVPVMADTADEIALGLMVRKLVASLQFEARDLTSALDAAGAGDADTEAALQQAAIASMGQAILDILEGQDALESRFAQVPVALATITPVVQTRRVAATAAPIDGKAAVQATLF